MSAVFDAFDVRAEVLVDVTDSEGGLEARNVGAGLHVGWRNPDRGTPTRDRGTPETSLRVHDRNARDRGCRGFLPIGRVC